MFITYLIRPGELTLKGGNRNYFEKLLKRNIRKALKPYSPEVWGTYGRFYLKINHIYKKEAENVLRHTFGIVAFSETVSCASILADITEQAVEYLGQQFSNLRGKRFKVQARRTRKDLPFTSYDAACKIGDHVRKTFPGM